jgi:hypothetical protein
MTFWLGYPVPLIVLGLVLAFSTGAAIVGISPFYWLARKWEQQHQRKLLIGGKRQIVVVDWQGNSE